MKLWLDDHRPMPPDYDHHARYVESALIALEAGVVTEISLDYDLGDNCDTGLEVALWLERYARDGGKRIRWHLHSDNIEGREKILRVMESAERHWLENEMAEQ